MRKVFVRMLGVLKLKWRFDRLKKRKMNEKEDEENPQEVTEQELSSVMVKKEKRYSKLITTNYSALSRVEKTILQSFVSCRERKSSTQNETHLIVCRYLVIVPIIASTITIQPNCLLLTCINPALQCSSLFALSSAIFPEAQALQVCYGNSPETLCRWRAPCFQVF